jgi:hypothetical protein
MVVCRRPALLADVSPSFTSVNGTGHADGGGHRRAEPSGHRGADRARRSRGTRHVTAALGLGSAVAAAIGAQVRLADTVMDRVAVPIASDGARTYGGVEFRLVQHDLAESVAVGVHTEQQRPDRLAGRAIPPPAACWSAVPWTPARTVSMLTSP